MKILVVGAPGTIGQAVVAALRGRHEVVEASRSKAAHTVDVTQPDSVAALFAKIGRVDGVISLSGGAKFAPLEKLTVEEFNFSLANKLMGQVNLARGALPHLNEGGAIVVTSGVLAWKPMPGSAAISVVNGALEGFAAAAALEAPRGIRVNVVSPPWVTETLRAMKWDLPGHRSAREVAELYVAAIESSGTGQIVDFSADGRMRLDLLSRR